MNRDRDPMKQATATRATQFMPRSGTATAEPLKFRVAGRADETAKRAANEPEPAAPAPAAPAILPAASLEKLASAIELLRLQCSRLAEQARSDALEIGFQIAHRILEAEIHASPEPLFALIRTAIRRAGESQRIVVRLCPADAANLKEWTETVAGEGASLAKVEVQPDSSLSPGDCMVDADFGTIDGRLASRLQEMRRAIDESQGDVA